MKHSRIIDLCAACFLAVSLLAVCIAFAVGGTSGSDSSRAAARLGKLLDRRLERLDRQVEKAFDQPSADWISLPDLPSDMVVYRYRGDTLQSWCNTFPVNNDGLHSRQHFSSISNPRAGLNAPFEDLGDEYSFCNFGPKWYLARALTRDGTCIVSGLELIGYADARSYSGINRRLGLPEFYSIQPLSSSEGTEVQIAGSPAFKLVCDTLAPGRLSADARWLFLGLFLFIVAAFCFVAAKPVLRRFVIAFIPIVPVCAALFFWGRTAGNYISLFSPTVYADGAVFYSLGAHIDFVVGMALLVFFLYIVRDDINRRLKSRTAVAAWSFLLIALIALIIVYAFVAVRSITLNSNISLELYKLSSFSALSAGVYAVYILLIICIVLLAQMLKLDTFSMRNRIGTAALAAGIFVAVTASLGIRKEKASLEVWASRLAVSRDIPLEMQLRSAEGQIASDPVIASLSVLDNGSSSIRSRLADIYLARVVQEYDVSVSLDTRDLARMRLGEPVVYGSRFVFLDSGNGFVSYVGAFRYDLGSYGYSDVIITIEQKSDWKYRGYASIMGPSLPGEVLLPPAYSFARYDADKLITFRGNFAYPVRMDAKLKRLVYGDGPDHLRWGDYAHFVYKVADDEAVIISRPMVNALNYAVSVLFVGLLVFLALSPFSFRRRRFRPFEQTYFQTRISSVVMVSLILSLVTMAVVSVTFVYNRNEVNRNRLMSEKINAIQSSVSARVRGASASGLRSPEVMRVIEDVGNNTNSDITLYAPDGMVMMSTAPAVFDQMQVDARMNAEAYRNITRGNERYYINREKYGRRSYYSMYAPLLADDGSLAAIICSPYTDETYDFETTAVNHLVMILSLFIFLLLVARFMVTDVLQRMFSPLLEMGRKMEAPDVGSLEYIRYDNQDEIYGLVSAYNRMVKELSESTRKLAQAERDKAWSGMARQVAHEIKNPLTPMKLQLQRLIRLKAKGDPAWQEKFDEVSKVLLDHIDILTDTANEFSTFAKLYTEEPSELDLSAMLQEEISMFDNREEVSFEFLGLSSAPVMGPKPQLTRVFVNLINNSVQALAEAGGGHIRISLRNSVQEGFYDIVFEDDGPGVADENVDKLFTPNFTTKTGGSGLGLAISRSILEKCGASISYSRSFALGGACFAILYPKK